MGQVHEPTLSATHVNHASPKCNMKIRVLFLTVVLTFMGAALSTTQANSTTVIVCPPATAAGLRHFKDYGSSPFFLAAEHDKSTFALDVDRASFDVAKLWLRNAERPPTGAIRPEEFVNALPYRYPVPDQGLSLSLDGVRPHPFSDDDALGLLRVVMQAADAPARSPMSIIICLDRSGSMQEYTGQPGQKRVKFELAHSLIQQLANNLQAEDRLGLVSYADDSTVDLEAASIATLAASLPAALQSLRSEGSTDLFSGLHLTYMQAAREKELWPDREVAIILISDGAANTGLTDHQQMLEQTESFRDQGIRLSTVGIGFDTLNDEVLEQLGDRGDGQYVFFGDPEDKERVLTTVMSHLLPVALEARSQLVFEPAAVTAWRQVGFENRSLRDEAFSDDSVDAGEVGAGQSVTVLYEIELADPDPAGNVPESEQIVATARLRWLDLEGQWSETSVILKRGDLQEDLVDEQFRAAAMMARWGQLIRREQEWDKAQFDQAYEQLMMFAFSPETPEDDPARAALRQQMSTVRTMMALDFGLGMGR